MDNYHQGTLTCDGNSLERENCFAAVRARAMRLDFPATFCPKSLHIGVFHSSFLGILRISPSAPVRMLVSTGYCSRGARSA